MPKPFHVFGSFGAGSKLPRGDKRVYTGTSWCWFKWDAANKTYDYSKVDDVRVRQTAKEWPSHQIMCIDIENFKADAYGNSQLEKVVHLVRAENPTIRLGFYGEMPKQEYWSRVPHSKNLKAIEEDKEPSEGNFQRLEARYKRAQAADEARKFLADQVDIIFPSCYTFYSDQVGWEHYATDQIKSARRYHKPVYVFLWPWYHDGSKQVEAAYFRKQLELCYKLTDGVVIWEENADFTTDWWKETLAFMDKYGLYK